MPKSEPVAPMKNAEVTERHLRLAEELRDKCFLIVHGDSEPITTAFRNSVCAEFLANLEAHAEARGRLAEHELLCCGPQHGIHCPRFEELALKLKELGE